MRVVFATVFVFAFAGSLQVITPKTSALNSVSFLSTAFAKGKGRAARRSARQAQRQFERESRRHQRQQEREARRAEKQQARELLRAQRQEERANLRADRRQERAVPQPTATSPQQLGENRQSTPIQSGQQGQSRTSPTSSRDANTASANGSRVRALDNRSDSIANTTDAHSGINLMNPPNTIAELFSQLGQSSAQPPQPPQPAIVRNALTPVAALGERAKNDVRDSSDALGSVVAPVKKRVKKKSSSRSKSGARRKVRRPGVFRAKIPKFSRRAPSEVLASNIKPATLENALNSGFQVAAKKTYSGLGMSVTQLIAPSGMSTEDAHKLLQQDPDGGLVEFNNYYRLYRTATVSSSVGQPVLNPTSKCGTGDCYGKDTIGWTQKLDQCAADVKVGVIDTGVDASHPVFSGQQIEFATTVAAKKSDASTAHGTGILAMLAGHSKSNAPGLIPSARFVTSDIFFKDSDGAAITDTMSLLNALELMNRRNVAVVNLSLSGPKDVLVEQAIKRLAKKGMIFVAAAGNGGPGAKPQYPAAYKPVIAVTAVSQKLRAFRYANRGAYIDIAAPGVRIWTALPERKYGFQSGTSFAVPYVTATVAALYRSLPRKTKKDALDRLSIHDLGKPGNDVTYGRGLMLVPQDCTPAAMSWSTTVRPTPSARREKPQLVSR